MNRETEKWDTLLVGLPSMIFSYIGGLFAYMTSAGIIDTWWFHLALVIVPSCIGGFIGGVVMLTNTWLKHRLEMQREALRLPKDPRPRPHLVEVDTEKEEQAS